MMIFPGGEVHTSLSTPSYPEGNPRTIKAVLRNSNDIMELLLRTNILSMYDLHLKMHYVPYARQDRVCNEGEPLSIKVFADLINSQGYKSVEILDPHSDVTPALIDRVRVIPRSLWINRIVGKFSHVICPDAGARKKALKDEDVFKAPIIYCDKVRNTVTGELSGFEVYADKIEGDVIIVDDICDGGGTFCGIAKILKEKGANSVSLAVSHGIFSKGLDVFDGLIDAVYTTDSWCNITHNKLKVFKL